WRLNGCDLGSIFMCGQSEWVPGKSIRMAWPSRRNPVRTRIRRWASHLPDGLVILSILFVGLLLVSLLTAASPVILTQSLRLAGGDEKWIRIIIGIIFVLVVALVFPMIVVFAYIVDILEGLVGTLCPS